MKNREKYADKIIDFACNSNDSITLNTKGEVVGCSFLDSCEDCKFYMEEDCRIATRRWLEEECVEPPVISRKDVRLLECIKCGYKYIARDYDGDIFLYTNKPEKGFSVWFPDLEFLNLRRFDVCFPMVKWEDEEPWKIKDLKKLEVVDEYE